MANRKLTELTTTATLSDNDLVYVVDVSAPAGQKSKGITKENLQTEIGGGAVDSVNGEVGTVVLATDDIADSTGFRYTNDSDIQRLSTTTGTNTGDQDLSAIESVVVSDTGSVIALTTIGGTASNFASANTKTAFTINNTANVLYAWNEVLINTATEPVITGATQEGGIAWTTGDLYLIVVNRRTHVSYMYQSKSIGSGGGSDTSEWATYSGTRAGGDLLVTLGDYDASNNAVQLIIDDANEKIKLINYELELSSSKVSLVNATDLRFGNLGDTLYGEITNPNTNLTANRFYDLPDASGTIALEPNLTEDATVTGTHDIDWNDDTHFLTLTGNTTFTESNLPATGFTKTLTIYVSGDFTLAFPTNWDTNLTGTYDGTVLNQIVIEYIKANTYWATINQAG